MLFRPPNAWAQVDLALQGMPWVHSKTVGPDGKVYLETWFSMKNGVSAYRRGADAEYDDITLKTVTKYVPDDGIIYRLPENPDNPSREPDFPGHLLDAKGPARSPVFGMDVVAQSRHDFIEDGRAWVEIDLP
jgi:hypothetical protein